MGRVESGSDDANLAQYTLGVF